LLFIPRDHSSRIKQSADLVRNSVFVTNDSQSHQSHVCGIGTERFQIEEISTRSKIPVFSIVVKQSVKEAITLMSKDIADQAEVVTSQVYEMIRDNTESGQSVLVVGVGNTVGIPQ